MIKYIFLTATVIFFALCAFASAILISRYTRLLAKYYDLVKYLKSLLHTVSSARWGNLQIKVEEGESIIAKDISKSLNSLLESILDRDKMIQEYVQKEKEQNNIREDFIAMLTHDLKVPIIAQDNTLDLLLEDKFGPLNDIQKDAIKNIKISNLDLKHLVESLLDSHAFEKKGFAPNIKNTNIREFIDEIIAQTNSVAALHNKTIRLYDNTSPQFCADTDPFLLRRVIQNLLLNAVSYGINSQYIDITLSNSDKEYTINIRDYGMGIAKENLDKIFNKYYSGAELYSKVSTGLGLYLSNKIVRALGGRIEVVSEVNHGARFSIILPH